MITVIQVGFSNYFCCQMEKSMKNIGKKIREIRLEKGFSQEELAEKSKLNLRTIQRIEKEATAPRGKTLHLLCHALELNLEDMKSVTIQKSSPAWGTIFVHLIYLSLLNLLFAAIIGYLTLDVEASLNSRFGGFLLSFCIPFVVIHFTQNMHPIERVLKFGSGYIFYFIFMLIVQGWQDTMFAGMRSGLFLCLILAIGTLFYGQVFFRNQKEE